MPSRRAWRTSSCWAPKSRCGWRSKRRESWSRGGRCGRMSWWCPYATSSARPWTWRPCRPGRTFPCKDRRDRRLAEVGAAGLAAGEAVVAEAVWEAAWAEEWAWGAAWAQTLTTPPIRLCTRPEPHA
ncbi:hypothetical protein BREVUG8_40131 [Brevundimonas sp. G8]|nr:hypothetical protein BREVUG8_40131 [Brevundimonas sp. G8]